MSSKYSCIRASVLAIAVAQILSAQAPAERPPANRDIARSLNTELLSLYSEYAAASPARRSALQREVSALAARRAVVIGSLIQKDPDTALQFVFSQDLLDEMAQAFPGSASHFESHGVWQGHADVWVQDAADMKSSKTTIKITAAKEQLDVVFAGGPPQGIQCGSSLVVRGVRSGRTIAAAGAEIALTKGVSSEAITSTCSTTGPQNTAVLLVTFPGVTPSLTPSAVSSMMFGAGNRSLDGYWRDASYGKTSATGSVFGWYTLPSAYTCDQYTSIQTAAIAAAGKDVNFPSYTRIFIVFPLPAGCTYGGVGTIGCSTITSAAGSSTASVSWLIADYLNPNDQGVELAAHEGGHNLGLNHSETRGFGSTTPLGALGSVGSVNEYGDYFSPMGYYNLGHYTAQQKSQIGWLTGSNVQTIQSSGSFSIAPYEWNTVATQALKIQRGTGNNDWLWLEYRQPVGSYDSSLSPQIFSGASVRYVDSYTGSFTNLLNYAPADSSWYNPALASGQSWVDPYSNLSLAVQGATANGLTVNVNFAAPTCTPANPTVTSSPANPTVAPGSTASYTVTIANKDSSACSPSTFSVSSSQPSGWTGLLSSSIVSLSPGASASVTMTQTPPVGTPAGTYAVGAVASRSAQSVMGPANCSVSAPQAPIAAVLTTNGSSFAGRGTISSTVTVSSSGLPVSGATVTFTMTKADGSTTSGTATSNASGQATWSYRLGPKDPSGTYSEMASVVYKTQATVTAVTTLSVQ